MPRREIGQETMLPDVQRQTPLDEILTLIDWSPIAEALDVVYCAPRGEASWPPLAMFKALLLSIWYDLSDVKLAEALDDRASFRRFCGFARSEATPERTAFVRFRRELVRHGLEDRLFDAITARLGTRAVHVKTGTIVDATIIASASVEDGEGHWVKHKGKPAVHGYKAHAGVDLDTALVEKLDATPANVNDGRAGPGALPDNPGDVYADSAYRGAHFSGAVARKGGVAHVVRTGFRAKDNPGAQAHAAQMLKEHNDAIHKVRGRIEKVFGTWKRSYGLRRMRWRGLAKARLQIFLTAIAYNFTRTRNIQASA